MRVLRRSAGVPRTPAGTRRKRVAHRGGARPALLIAPKHADRIRDSAWLPRDPPIPHISTEYSRWILARAITMIHVRIAIELPTSSNIRETTDTFALAKFVINLTSISRK